MTYLVREDGEHFVIPSYRDVLSAKKKNRLKDEILLLSQSYGEYITLQRKSITQYEVAFSPDRGYLLGESIWQYFKSPMDLVYCEAIPNTTEAILVIVKAGSVYLDGRFPLEGLQEELVIFLTQKNNFDIYIYGEVPISESTVEGKFTFDAASVKSFNKLTQAIFPNLPLYKMYELKLVDPVLKSQGIGVLPVRQALIFLVFLVVIWMAYEYLSTPSTTTLTTVAPIVVDPYQEYTSLLASPAPEILMNQLVEKIALLTTMPGWQANTIKFANNTLIVSVKTPGSKVQLLLDWAKQHDATVAIKAEGIEVTLITSVPNRVRPTAIHPIQAVVTKIVDRLSTVYPGNNLSLELTNKDSFVVVKMNLTLNAFTVPLLSTIGQQFKDLPVVLRDVSLNITDGMVNGSIIFDALGSPT